MEVKHTPGPWHITESSDWMGTDGVSMGVDDEFGADGGRDYFLATVVHGDPEVLKANAKLVSAAPELLAAALLAYRLLNSVAFVSNEGDTATPLHALRAAIAKATS